MGRLLPRNFVSDYRNTDQRYMDRLEYSSRWKNVKSVNEFEIHCEHSIQANISYFLVANKKERFFSDFCFHFFRADLRIKVKLRTLG